MEPTPIFSFYHYEQYRSKPTARFSVEVLSAMLSRGEFITDYEKTLVRGYAINQRNKKKNKLRWN